MNLNSKTYWNNRAKKFGHTGWTDFATYFYDQNLRLNTIKKILVTSGLKCNTGLDYGCGTGEFCKMIIEFCDKVIATDISEDVLKMARSKNADNAIEYLLFDDSVFKYQYDLILTVTVLQHIIDNNDLAEIINNFKLSLRENGTIIVFESFSEQTSTSDFLNLRNAQELQKIFTDSGFVLKTYFNYYHPLTSPTVLFNKYRTNKFVILLNMLCFFAVPGSRFLLKRIATYVSDKDNGIVHHDTCTKILIFGK